MSELKPTEVSPRWGGSTKIVVALTVTAGVIALLFRFRNLIGPLLLAFIIAYLLYPLAERIHKYLHFKWQLVVTILYLITIIVIAGLLTLGGLALFNQIQSLIEFLQNAVISIPEFLNTLEHTTIHLGRIEINPANYDLTQLTNQLMTLAQNLLSRIGTLVGVIASGAAEVIGTIAFTLLVSYFILVETSGIPGKLINISVPRYNEDLSKISRRLGKIWNTFLRGQMLIILITIAVYIVLLGSLGVKYYLGLALLAGLARFVPYIGPFVAWTTYFLVAYFQSFHPFGLQPFYYAAMIVIVAWVTDAILDNFVATRLLAKVLKVHPAAVLVAALVGASLFGLIGVVLAAPVLATLKLVMIYIMRKMFDEDPWEQIDLEESMPPPKTTVKKLRDIWIKIRGLMRKILNKTREIPE